MKTITIEIPDDTELVKEGDIYRVRQVAPKTWEEFCNRTPIRQEYFIGYDSRITLREYKDRNSCGDRNLHESKTDAEAVLALIQLIRLRKAWVGEWDPERTGTSIYYIQSTVDRELIILSAPLYRYRHTLTFPSESIAKQFMECFKNLLNEAERFLA